MSDPIFNNLMKHTCDIERAITLPANDDTYGHVTVQRSQTVKAKTGIACRLMSINVQEMERKGLSPTVSGEYALYIRYTDLPPGLSMREGLASFTVTNIRHRDGREYDAGPFDIKSVADAAGESHHAKLMLGRLTSGIASKA